VSSDRDKLHLIGQGEWFLYFDLMTAAEPGSATYFFEQKEAILNVQ
jgi:hypothetical protein